jgi:predicted dehydrogenase
VASVGYRTGAPEHGTELTCTNGILRVHSVAGVQIGRDESWEQVPDSGSGSWMDEALELQWREFVRAVATGTEPVISGSDARRVMAALFAAEASSEQGREIVVAGG